MLLLLAAAQAAPLAPAAAQSVQVGIEMAGFVSTGHSWLTVPDCEGDACRAVRAEVVQGGGVDLRLFEHLGVYAQGGRLVESNAALAYYGVGYSLAGGIKGGFDLKAGFGVDGWAGLTMRRSTDPSVDVEGIDQASRLEAEAGIDLRWGTANDGFMTWIGADITAFTNDETIVLDNTAFVDLRPTVPASATAGLLLVSDPLGGPWAHRGRVGVGVSGTAGYHTSVTGWIVAAL